MAAKGRAANVDKGAAANSLGPREEFHVCIYPGNTAEHGR